MRGCRVACGPGGSKGSCGGGRWGFARAPGRPRLLSCPRGRPAQLVLAVAVQSPPRLCCPLVTAQAGSLAAAGKRARDRAPRAAAGQPPRRALCPYAGRRLGAPTRGGLRCRRAGTSGTERAEPPLFAPLAAHPWLPPSRRRARRRRGRSGSWNGLGGDPLGEYEGGSEG